MDVLGVAVSDDLHHRWRRWLAPEVQPFFVDSLGPWPRSLRRARSLDPELRDTYKAWRIDRSLEILWLDESTFLGMSRSQRTALVRAQVAHRRGAVPSVRRWSDVLDPETTRSQADGRRFVWWPSLVARDPHAVLPRVVTASLDGEANEALPSRHREVARTTWDGCASVLPEARRIAGSFAPSSGPNCFGTVMAAAGAIGAAHEWMLQAPFLAWLDAGCRPGGRDCDPGTVLLWRDSEGAPVHAAVTIGDGWALEKASQEWWTPRAVRVVGDVVRATRARGQHLERHRILALGSNAGGRAVSERRSSAAGDGSLARARGGR
ncbi:MAG: hypothetical protein ACRDYW_11650 [Acidimicrobiales bacterium]